MKLENTHQRIMNIIIDCYRIFFIYDNGNPYFSFLVFDSFFQLCFKRNTPAGKQQNGNEAKKHDE